VKKPIVGIVGGVGSGKSVVAAEFVRRGGFLIDADVLGHEALQQPDIQAKIEDRWGSRVLKEQGAIDRRALGKVVFTDAAERKKLEELVFPWIERRTREEIDRAQADATKKWIVFDAAIMLETGWHVICDKIVFVDAPLETRQQRSRMSRRWTEEEFRLREQAQFSVEEKRRRSDDVVDNSGTRDKLGEQVESLLKQWRWKVECRDPVMKPGHVV
jgi:dephospho-CoA kinase